jgi:phosphomannomutase
MSLMISVSGIRGIVGDTLDAGVVHDFAAAFGSYIGPGRRVVLARDSRPSGAEYHEVACRALTARGCDVVDVGIVSTPGAALMVTELGADGGIILTASHNPTPWNGLKFLTPEGLAPPLEQAQRIWVLRDTGEFTETPDGGPGSVSVSEAACPTHVHRVLQRIGDPQTIRGRGFRVVLDSVHGAGGAEGRELLQALNCDLTHLYAEPNGQFPHAPEPLAENLGTLCETVRKQGADVGFAQDPDADRLAIVDERGRYIGEEYTLALSAMAMFAATPGPAATNQSTSRMIDDLAAAAGPPCVVHRTAVGEAHVIAGIRGHGCVIGGEGNGGVIDPQIVLVRNSLVAMSQVLQLLARERRPLSDIVARMPRYTMIKEKFACADAAVAAAALQAVGQRFSDVRCDRTDGLRLDWPEGWVHIRPSNTEPILRIIAESNEAATTKRLIQQVKDACGSALG